MCAIVAKTMLSKYAGSLDFDRCYIDFLIGIYRKKLPQLLQYDRLKNFGIMKEIKHVMFGMFPHLVVEYWKLKNYRTHSSCNLWELNAENLLAVKGLGIITWLDSWLKSGILDVSLLRNWFRNLRDWSWKNTVLASTKTVSQSASADEKTAKIMFQLILLLNCIFYVLLSHHGMDYSITRFRADIIRLRQEANAAWQPIRFYSDKCPSAKMLNRIGDLNRDFKSVKFVRIKPWGTTLWRSNRGTHLWTSGAQELRFSFVG